jgi:hypothetical protein
MLSSIKLSIEFFVGPSAIIAHGRILSFSDLSKLKNLSSFCLHGLLVYEFCIPDTNLVTQSQLFRRMSL